MSEPTDEPGAEGQVPLGPAERLGGQDLPSYADAPGSHDALPSPTGEVLPAATPVPRRRGRLITAGVVALVLLVGVAGVLVYLRTSPQLTVMNAAQATTDSDGVARVTMSGSGSGDVVYEIGWQHDPGAVSGSLVRVTPDGDQAWVQFVSTGEHLYARSDVWSKHMLGAGSDDIVPPALQDLPPGKVTDAIEAGRWIELPVDADVPMTGTDLGFASDPAIRADLDRLREIVEGAVRGHATVEAQGSDERGDKYRVVVDLKQAVLDNADDLESVMRDLIKHWMDRVKAQAQLPGVADLAVPDIDVREEAKDLKPVPFTLWVRDGRLSGLRFSASDLGESDQQGYLDVELRPATGPLVPTDPVKVSKQDLEDLQQAIMGRALEGFASMKGSG